jgi:hypothetical protein
MPSEDLSTILRGLKCLIGSLASVSEIIEMHECLNPVYDENMNAQNSTTSLPSKRRRTYWSAEETESFLCHMNSMDNTALGELFGRSHSEIVNKRRVEGRKAKRRRDVG